MELQVSRGIHPKEASEDHFGRSHILIS